jgi:hypothetical protein
MRRFACDYSGIFTLIRQAHKGYVSELINLFFASLTRLSCRYATNSFKMFKKEIVDFLHVESGVLKFSRSFFLKHMGEDLGLKKSSFSTVFLL